MTQIVIHARLTLICNNKQLKLLRLKKSFMPYFRLEIFAVCLLFIYMSDLVKFPVGEPRTEVIFMEMFLEADMVRFRGGWDSEALWRCYDIGRSHGDL